MGRTQRSGQVVSQYAQADPAPALRAYVACYGGYRDAGVAPALHRGLPSPHLTFIVTLDDPLVLLEGGDRHRFDTLLGGLHTSPVTITHDGRQSGVQISLHPLGARALFGCPAAELGPGNHHATDVAAGWLAELQDRVRGAAGWPERFAAVDTVLLRVLQPATIDASLLQAWRALSGGGRSVGAVADRIGWGTRRLSREFGAEFGVGPKTAARLGRFDRARRRLQAPDAPLLADLAAEHGFYDQAHLAREFREFAGVAPTVWLAEERRSVQAEGATAPAGSSP